MRDTENYITSIAALHGRLKTVSEAEAQRLATLGFLAEFDIGLNKSLHNARLGQECDLSVRRFDEALIARSDSPEDLRELAVLLAGERV